MSNLGVVVVGFATILLIWILANLFGPDINWESEVNEYVSPHKIERTK